MARQAALPFMVKRKRDVFGADSYTSTRETVHGLLLLQGDRLVIQSRMARKTDTFGTEMRSDEEMEPVREAVIPLAGVTGSSVRGRWWSWPGPRLIIRAADLRAFESVVGDGGPSLGHPGELVLPVRRNDLLTAHEFSAELALAIAEQTAYGSPRLSEPGPEVLPRPEPEE